MTELLKLKSSKVYARYLKKIDSINGMIIRNNGRPLVNILCLCVTTGGFMLNKGTIKVIVTYLFFINKLVKKTGFKFTVIYLKASFVALQQASGGHVLRDMTPLGCRVRRTGGGLPRVIPLLHRNAIRKGDHRVLRLWLTLLSVFRLISFKGKVRLDSITSVGTMSQEVLDSFSSFVPIFMIMVKKLLGRKSPIVWKILNARPFLISSATPAVGHDNLDEEVPISILSTSPIGIIRSALIWKTHPLMDSLTAWCRATRNIWVLNRLQTIQRTVSELDLDKSMLSKKRSLGSLGFIEESAGKVRVVAMVDCWTQWILDPLMKRLSKLLSCIPNDGTKSQLSPLHRLMKMSKGRTYYCYDLSSATDRLPVILQCKLLEPLIGVKLAELWRSLLVDRPYIAKNDKYGIGTTVKYVVGQPMGAKSSFHMMGLLHHALVQWAAYRAGLVNIITHKWFDYYAIVGDDIVITDDLVAREYVSIMSEIGVSIGLHKSLVSPHSVEFVKRTFFKGKDVSAVPISEVDVARLSTAQRLELARKYKLTLASYLRLGSFGYRVIGSLSRRLTLMGRRARSQIVQFYSPYGVVKYPLNKWIALKTGLGACYALTPRKESDLVRSFLIEERARLLKRLEIMSERVKPLWSLVSVKRDREYYGIIPHIGDRKTIFPYFKESNRQQLDPVVKYSLLREKVRPIISNWGPGDPLVCHPDISIAGPALVEAGRAVRIDIDVPSHQDVATIEPVQHAFDVIKELVYRGPFLDMIISVRDLKLTIEDPAEAVARGILSPTDKIDLSSAWSEVWDLEKQINEIVPYADIFVKKETLFTETLSKTLKAWDKWSKFARSTRSM